ncbi:SDR family NAD(P)-dependent oxidoreductase [Terribacillus sp. DMT04]|uniref:SDR family NAD(P)-dependent oxidoreductase n=1 Tax=Terribacillus sp. DMT04 TaxID=2850441 RepID=UPI001C2C5F70|nr:SDR family NAD(P)-dependent oxidoreductase [Terribacillus sp. DMT04]QXE02644.1 SDR family NAD(P)-dependent oxidoreductase [Terribacillus sp. DMT04]
MKTAVVTGTSRGLGEAIAKHLMDKEVKVIGVARKDSNALPCYKGKGNASYTYRYGDLQDTAACAQIFEELAADIFSTAKDTVYLINNAGVVGPIATADAYSLLELEAHLAINLTAPMLVCSIFLKYAKTHNVPLVIVNVTSGAAERSVHGWSAYSTSKAGLNRYTETVALEEAEAGSGNIAIAYNPGIMDTGMQADIRSSEPEQFQDVQKFKDYVTNKSLRDPMFVGGVLVDILTGESIENGKRYAVKDYV